MKLLMITRKVDSGDALAGFTYGWVKKIGENLEKLYVISWQEGNARDLPSSVEVHFLSGGKLTKVMTLQKKLLSILPKVSGVFCHMNPEYTILAGPLAKIMGRRVVSWYTHRSITIRRRLVELLADRIVTASKESFRQSWFPKKLEVIGHGIDPDHFYVKNSYNETKDYFDLLTVGRISPTKDYESMIKAVDILADKRVRLQIIGGVGLKSQNNYLASLHDMVKKMNLTDQVKFIGEVPNNKIRQYLWQADAFINLSGTGSLDKAILEAMACGRLVLTSNEALKRFLPSELMIEKNQPDQLAQKIGWLMKLSLKRKNELAQILRNEVIQKHNLDNLAKKIIDQFKI